MFGQQTFGKNDQAVMDAQIASAQQVFHAPAWNFAAIQARLGTVRSRYVYGTHEAAIHQQQITNASRVFQRNPGLPLGPYLGLVRAFPISQEEQPQDSPSAVFNRGVYLTSTVAQNPLGRPALQTLPQYPPDQDFSFIFKKLPSSSGIPIQAPTTIAFVQSYPQEIAPWDATPFSSIMQPVGQTSMVALLPPPNPLTLEEVLSPAGEWSGSVILTWGSSGPGVAVYNVYVTVNGVLTTTLVPGLGATLHGLLINTDYTFAVVATSGIANIDSSPLSNVIAYRHAQSAEFESSFTYPYGNTFKTGYIIVVPLFTPE